MSVQEKVKQFVMRNFYVDDPAELGEDSELIGGGYVDSTGMLEIVAFLEAEYGLAIDDREMIPENLETIARIAAFVARKRAATQAAAVA